MAYPTSTRAELRRAICAELGMEFFRRYPSYLTCDSGSTTDKIVDSDLVQQEDFWKNMWVYIAEDTDTGTGAPSALVGDVRLVSTFSNVDDALFVERAFSTAPTNTLRYEIHDVWNATEIHNAINRAIRDAIPNFFDIVTDESLVLQEDKLSYDISGLTYRPWIVGEVWLERTFDSITGTVDSASNTSLTDAGADFSEAGVNHRVSIYEGTGKGQLRTCQTGTSAGVLTISAAWTTNPDNTSKYRYWDSLKQLDDWYRMTSLRFDKSEYPDTMYLPKLMTGLYGSRIRLVYATDALELSSDADTTIVPAEFIIYKAIAYLAGSRVWGRTADREKYAILEQTANAKAEAFRGKMAFRMDSTLWQESDYGDPGIHSVPNPMGW